MRCHCIVSNVCVVFSGNNLEYINNEDFKDICYYGMLKGKVV